MNIYIESLGCFKNKADTEYLLTKLVENGHIIVESPSNADFLLINTCGFIKPAVQESIEGVLTLSKFKSNRQKLIAFGCMTERYKKDLKELLPEVDLITGVNSYNEITSYINNRPSSYEYFSDGNNHKILTNLPYFTFVKISDGCDNRCNYCVIPIIKGELISKPIDAIVEEVKVLVNKGIKEIILIAQDITKYGLDLYGNTKLYELLIKICNIDGDFFIRLLYLNPDSVDTKLIKLVSDSEKIIKYLDIPVQHINDKILKSMNRKTNSKGILTLFDNIKTICPEIILRTTFIVGFPGEGSKEFEDILKFISDKKPDYAGFFPFYPEDGAKASKFPGRVKSGEIKKRINILSSLQTEITTGRFNSLKGSKHLCFIETYNKEKNIFEGRSVLQAPEIDGKTYINNNNIEIHDFGPYNCMIDDFIYPDIYCTIKP